MGNKVIDKIPIDGFPIGGKTMKDAILSSGYSIRRLAKEIGYSDRQVRTYLDSGYMPNTMYEKIIEKIYSKEESRPMIRNMHDDFFDWLACAVVLDSDWEENPGFYREVICRKLVRIGKLKIDGDCYALIDPEKEN